ncbi:hypothetical protein Rumeso_04444 [Rubellimicrobium mesophilum DSM 19309]|uniref:DUF4864 domain-containing protein n=1 Tax=Rubellimicrobium mesophilum DSM 19309 TaxID=442562 RepID=A0A017HHP2_9RHOB|nr:DUF4864 domain-containing protein [Rubellimicrobium mesophilum]EYD74002.1 hypothetical protein Rumeso_04444 [Rubellimicrobium mesophilum DSM 19309]
MRLLPTLALLAWPLGAAAQDAQTQAAIEAVIADQLSDFNARDVPGAWEHASPGIQGIFGTPENFGRMVEDGYPMVWDNHDARFLELGEEGGALHQRVLLKDPEGRGWVLDYEMVELPDGWRIDGVQVLPAPDVAA